jgi:formylglycine-generating enzyme required for sulfatase activity
LVGSFATGLLALVVYLLTSKDHKKEQREVESKPSALANIATNEGADRPRLTNPIQAPAPVKANETLIKNSIGMELKLIPADEFMMGAAPGDTYGFPEEKLQHSVRISRPFYLGIYEVTQAEFRAVVGTNPSYFSSKGGGKAAVANMNTDRFPVENVSWHDAIVYCAKLSEREGLKPCNSASGDLIPGGTGYRLPTEAEWEYACRAGTTTQFAFGAKITPKDANFNVNRNKYFTPSENFLGRTAAVGSYRPNSFGLYDMHGNVSEWCQDWYDENYLGVTRS